MGKKKNSKLRNSSKGNQYCICDDLGSGDMIKCDNEQCTNQWYHLSCIDLLEAPVGDWMCPSCSTELPNSTQKEIEPTQSQFHSGYEDPPTTPNISNTSTFVSATNTRLSKPELLQAATDWTLENLVSDQNSIIMKTEIRRKYNDFCDLNGIQGVSEIVFGKVMKSCFPSIKTRRLRGIQHFSGISWVNAHSAATNTEIEIEKEESSHPEDNYFEDLFPRLKSTMPTLRRCPRGARQEVALQFSKALEDVTNVNSTDAWKTLLLLPFATLRTPEKSDNVRT